MIDDLEWSVPVDDPTRPERKPRVCRHDWWRHQPPIIGPDQVCALAGTGLLHEECRRCGRIKDPVASRRGRSSLRAGKDAERAIAKAYPNGKRTGQFGGPDDVVVGDLFIVQSKAGRTWFVEKVWDELAKLPRVGGRVPTLIVSDRPGPGHRTRRYVIRTMDDDISLHGKEPA